jgi:signal transduction histidine kinase
VRLIDDLMDVSRITRGRVELRRERVELRALVDSALEASQPLLEAAGHALAVRVPKGIVLDADPTRMAQVIANLLNNSAKYTPEGGRITLTAERQGDNVLLRVTDTGVGIPAEMLPQVFDMFTQVGRTLDRSQGGLGIGLTLVRRLVEMHGGTVDVESAGAGQGTTFTLCLPVAGSVDTEELDKLLDQLTARA